MIIKNLLTQEKNKFKEGNKLKIKLDSVIKSYRKALGIDSKNFQPSLLNRLIDSVLIQKETSYGILQKSSFKLCLILKL